MFKSKEERQDAKMEKFINKYHLEEIDEKDMEAIKEISSDLLGLTKFNGMMTLKADQQAYVSHLSALVQQNWIIIRKLSEISRKLDK